MEVQSFAQGNITVACSIKFIVQIFIYTWGCVWVDSFLFLCWVSCFIINKM